MLNNIFQPYHTMQEINLDWILTKVKNILRFVPDDGSVGQILRRTAHGAEWSNEQGGGGAVDSVNGQTGTVVLTASDVGALPDTYSAPVDSVNGQTGTVVLGKSDIGLGNVANVLQYSSSNPPPYPVTSVNGQTGDVIVSGGAVDSVNGQTGTVVLGKSDIGLGNVDNVQQYSASNPPPYPVTSVNGLTGDVTIPTITKEALVVTAVNQANINVNAYKSGYTVLVTGINAVYPYAISADTKIASINIPPATQAFGIGKTLSGNDVFVFVNTLGELFVSGLTPVPASQNMYFSLVYFTA